MGTVLLTRETAPHFTDRLAKIGPDARGLWGALDPPNLMAHLRRTFEISLGEVDLPDESNILMRTVMKWLAFHVIPWPKGKIKASASFTPEAKGTFEEERDRLLAAIERFVAAQEADPQRKVRSPVFGLMTLRYWGRVHGKHLDHHLRQHGV